LERLTPQEYELLRAAYVRAGKGTPPPGATPLPVVDESRSSSDDPPANERAV
jgi:bacterioferritin-associated ferredoxin